MAGYRKQNKPAPSESTVATVATVQATAYAPTLPSALDACPSHAMAQQPLTCVKLRAPIAKWVAEVVSEADKVATLVPAMDLALDSAMVPAHPMGTEVAVLLLEATEVVARLLKATKVATLSPK